MCQSWSASLQKGMNFHLRPHCSVILMSRRPNAPYRDSIEDEGRVIIYEGHDVPRRQGQPDPKILDQPRTTPAGALTQNGLFEQAALRFRRGASEPESVAVYEKIRDGIWAFNGMFKLTDAWVESDSRRKVFKFRLEIILEGPAFELDLRGRSTTTGSFHPLSNLKYGNEIEVAAFYVEKRIIFTSIMTCRTQRVALL